MQDVKTDRNKYIGGSDIPIIMGISSFKTRFELLLEKAELKEDNFEGNEYTEYGNEIEPIIREYVNKTLKKEFKEGKHIYGDIRIHTDGEDDEEILEIKSTSQIHQEVNEYKIYLSQLLFYMEKEGKEKGTLAVYERPSDFSIEFNPARLQIFHIEKKNYLDFIDRIEQAVKQFKIDLAKIKENPFLTEEQLMPVDIVKATKKVVAMEKKLAKYKEIEEEYNKAKEQLKKLMMETDNKKWETPNGIKITLVEDTPDKEVDEEYYNEEKFKKENSSLYEDYHNKLEEYKETKKITKKGKKGYVKITLPKE